MLYYSCRDSYRIFLCVGGGECEHWSLASTCSKGLSNALFAVKCIWFHQNNYCIDEKTKKGWALKNDAVHY